MNLIKKIAIVVFFGFGLIFSTVVLADDAIKTELITARAEIDQAITDQGSDLYETDSYTAFSDGLSALGGLTAVDDMIADPFVVQGVVDQMVLDLNSLLDGLVTAFTYNTIFVQHFQETNRDTTPYTLRSIALYDAELNRIKDIIDEPTSGEVLIQSLSADITAASSLLVLLGDKTDLQVKYNQAEAIYLDGSNYIPSTYSAFQIAYSAIDTTLITDIGFTKLEVINNSDASLPEVTAALNEIESALSILVLKPDKTALTQAYNDAVALDKTVYTLDSRTLFNAGLVPINQIILNVEALEVDVNQATTDLTNLYGVLVLKGDYSSLQTSIDNLDDFDFELYTPASVTLFNLEVSRISLIMVDENSTVEIIDTLTQDFSDAFDILVQRADKTDLVLYNNQAILAYYEEKSLYTASSYALFKTAVINYGTYLYVNQVIADPDALQADVDTLSTKVMDALVLLDPLIDNSLLLTIYENVGAIIPSFYTPQSLETFNIEYSRIHSILTGKELSQSVYDQILIDLENIQSILVLRADSTELVTLYNSLLNKNEELYSVSSYAYFTEVMNQSLAIMDDLNASQAEVDSAVTLLQHSASLLRAKLGVISIKANSYVTDINASITLGNATIVSFVSSDESILTVDSNGKVRGIAFGEASVTVTLSNGVVETLNFLVKANVKTVTLILAISLPVLSVSVGVGMLFIKKEHWAVFKKLMFWKKRT